MRYIEAMPPQLKYIKSQKYINKTSYFDPRESNPIKLFILPFLLGRDRSQREPNLGNRVDVPTIHRTFQTTHVRHIVRTLKHWQYIGIYSNIMCVYIYCIFQ
jgi:hypothetical protein